MKSVFPYHHIVSDERVQHICHLYSYKNTIQFRSDLDYLLKNFDPVSPVDLVTYIEQHQKLPSRKFLLTFDDGFREVKEVIAPVLKKKGIPAIFFVNPAYIDNREMFYRNKISVLIGELEKQKANDNLHRVVAGLLRSNTHDLHTLKAAMQRIRQDRKELPDQIAQEMGISFDDYLAKHRPWLTSGELASLSSEGFTIGAHSWDHPYYQFLSLEDQLRETFRSCDYVRQFNGSTVSFSFPHSDAGLSQTLFDNLVQQEQGIKLMFGIQNQKDELHNQMIHRFNAERPERSMKELVKGIFSYAAVRKFINLQTVTRHA